MKKFTKLVEQVDLNQVDENQFARHHVGCIVLTKDNKILLQQRGDHWNRFPSMLATFGGRIEADETPMQALIRELNEELGAEVNERDVISFGAITEAITGYNELVYVYFWQDKLETVTGCYEGEARYYDNLESALTHPKIMDDVRWLLTECRKRNLL